MNFKILDKRGHSESHNQFKNSSELIEILIAFITLCHG